MILGARLLMFVVILDCFLYFGLSATGGSTAGFGNQFGQFVQYNDTSGTASANQSNINNQLNWTQGGSMTQASTFGYQSFGLNNIFGFVDTVYKILAAPLTFAHDLGMPAFIQVLIGSAYIIMVLGSVVQLITGRFA